jgi:hypothetical protein
MNEGLGNASREKYAVSGCMRGKKIWGRLAGSALAAPQFILVPMREHSWS